MGFLATVFVQKISVLGCVSVALILIWAWVCLAERWQKLRWTVFVGAHIVLHIDRELCRNECFFLVSAVLLLVTVFVGVVTAVRTKQWRITARNAVYFLLSAIPIILFITYFLVHIAFSDFLGTG